MKHSDFAVNMIRQQLLDMVNRSKLRAGERNSVFEAAEIIGQLMQERDEAREALDKTGAVETPAPTDETGRDEILLRLSDAGEAKRVWKSEIYFESEEERDEFERKLTEGWSPLEWISAEHEVPADDGLVLCLVTGKYGNREFRNAYELAEWSDMEGWILKEYPDIVNPGVTHWMELPEEPEGE